jgi:hypothetical protein
MGAWATARASRWAKGAALVLLAGVTAVACAKGASGPGSSEGAGGNGGGVITGAGGHATGPSMSGPGGSMGSSPTSVGAAGGSSVASTGSGACGETPCKLVAPQCGCPAGKECNLDAMGMRACVAAGTKGPHQSCASVSDCAPGLICLQASATSNACGTFCESDGDCTGGTCSLSLSNGTSNIPNVTLCSTTCDPITNSGCTVAGSGCLVGQETGGAMRWFTSCYPAGAGVQGSTCTTSADCSPRLWCITSSSQGNICAGFCNVNAPSCPGGTSCAAVQDQNMQPIMANGVTYGACLPP